MKKSINQFKVVNLQCVSVRSGFAVAIKRESGESPEQSRCCKFHIMLQTMNSLSMPLETFSGKAACNRNKSEDLPCIILSLLSRKKR